MGGIRLPGPQPANPSNPSAIRAINKPCTAPAGLSGEQGVRRQARLRICPPGVPVAAGTPQMYRSSAPLQPPRPLPSRGGCRLLLAAALLHVPLPPRETTGCAWKTRDAERAGHPFMQRFWGAWLQSLGWGRRQELRLEGSEASGRALRAVWLGVLSVCHAVSAGGSTRGAGRSLVPALCSQFLPGIGAVAQGKGAGWPCPTQRCHSGPRLPPSGSLRPGAGSSAG